MPLVSLSCYMDLCRQMEKLLKDNSVQRELEEFDHMMPFSREILTPMKKLDYLLWAAGK